MQSQYPFFFFFWEVSIFIFWLTTQELLDLLKFKFLGMFSLQCSCYFFPKILEFLRKLYILVHNLLFLYCNTLKKVVLMNRSNKLPNSYYLSCDSSIHPPQLSKIVFWQWAKKMIDLLPDWSSCLCHCKIVITFILYSFSIKTCCSNCVNCMNRFALSWK